VRSIIQKGWHMQNTSDIINNACKIGIVIPAFNVPYLPMVEPVIRAVEEYLQDLAG